MKIEPEFFEYPNKQGVLQVKQIESFDVLAETMAELQGIRAHFVTLRDNHKPERYDLTGQGASGSQMLHQFSANQTKRVDSYNENIKQLGETISKLEDMIKLYTKLNPELGQGSDVKQDRAKP